MTFYALRRLDTGAFLASNPDPSLGQPYAETMVQDEAVAWPAMTLAVINQEFLADADGWEVVAVARFEVGELVPCPEPEQRAAA